VQFQTQERQRRAVEVGTQAKTDANPPCYPVCRQQLTRLTHGHERTFRTCFEPGTYDARAAGVVAIRSGVSRPTLRGGLQDSVGSLPVVLELATADRARFGDDPAGLTG
jgi:hypothetical protein